MRFTCCQYAERAAVRLQTLTGPTITPVFAKPAGPALALPESRAVAEGPAVLTLTTQNLRHCLQSRRQRPPRYLSDASLSAQSLPQK
jgi:hypothetical protein